MFLPRDVSVPTKRYIIIEEEEIAKELVSIFQTEDWTKGSERTFDTQGLLHTAGIQQNEALI